jgi:Uma2 family endonuclease
MTPATELEEKVFQPGTLGWTANDLEDDTFEHAWDEGRFEIIEGALTQMPPANFDGSQALAGLEMILYRHLLASGERVRFTHEIDLILKEDRVVRPDMAYISEADLARQREANKARGGRRTSKMTYGRVLVPPTLIVESVSPGHGAHDRQTKRAWYAEARVPNYWILDRFDKSLECLVLEGDVYRTDAAGRNDEDVRPTLFPGLVISLAEIWDEVGGSD